MTLWLWTDLARSTKNVMVNKIAKINVGSQNRVKVCAVEEILGDYLHLKDAKVISIDAVSEVDDQPRSLDETVQGAINRAKNAYQDCDYSFGLESGMMAVPNTKTGHMDVCVCAIFDGEEYHLGLSSAWETPKDVANYMFNEGLNMNDAAYKAGLTEDLNVGAKDGLIGIMTKGRLTRKEYTKEAIRTALIHLEV